MAISAFTNQPGSYFKSDFRQNTIKGFYLSQKLDEKSYNTILTDWSYKSETIHGNHLQSLPYTRKVSTVSKDIPSTKRTVWIDGGVTRADYVETRFLSPDIPTMFMSPPGQFQADLDTARNEAVTKARLALQGDGTVQNGADLAESRQTVNMIAQTTSSLAKAAMAAKRGDWPGVARHLGVQAKDIKSGTSVAQGWLGYQYGWKPLMSSIYDNYQLLKATPPESNLILVKKTAVRELQAPVSGEFVGTWSCKGFVTCGLTARIDNAFFRSADTYGLINPLSVGWEVVPFSFVFDWFIPVGDMLQSLSATSGLTFLDGYVSTSTTCKYSASRDGDYLNPGLVEVVNFTFTRDVINGFPLPGVYGKRNPFTTTHTANALALIRGSMR